MWCCLAGLQNLPALNQELMMALGAWGAGWGSDGGTGLVLSLPGPRAGRGGDAGLRCGVGRGQWGPETWGSWRGRPCSLHPSSQCPHVAALQEEWPGVDMSADTELLWPGAALLLLLLGAAAGLCVRCSPRTGKGWGHRCEGGACGVPSEPLRPRPGCSRKGQSDKPQEAEVNPRGLGFSSEDNGSGSLGASVLLGQGHVSGADGLRWTSVGRGAGLPASAFSTLRVPK